jgi:DUF1680 family protein
MNLARITAGFWHTRLDVNARIAIFHQWDQLVSSGCIQNFHIAAGEVEGLRNGWFFADSDAYKWLDAASRITASQPEPGLTALMDAFISLLGRTQMPDGYLFTYNQIHFPGIHWLNLQIEHELYCHGHLIEAGVSHFEATGKLELLEIARRAADCIVRDFLGKGPKFTPGHEEIEIALLRLHQSARNGRLYLDMARQFIEERGHNRFFFLSIIPQLLSMNQRLGFVRREKKRYLAAHPDYGPCQLPPYNAARKPRNAMLRWIFSALNGKFFQQNAPVREQTTPVGHAVRFGYMETATAMLARLSGDRSLVPPLEQAWENMVSRRMYITGGLGSLAGLEGFGRDFELDPEYAYAETCAALAGMFWNWEMSQLTGQAKYSDLLEWQLYNAALVGMGLDGSSYFFNNPLVNHGGVVRKTWYAVPCCPSNLSRTFAGLGNYIFSHKDKEIYIHQFIDSELIMDLGIPVKIQIETSLPWNGKVILHIDPVEKTEFSISLRSPSWSPEPPVILVEPALSRMAPKKYPPEIFEVKSLSMTSKRPVEKEVANGKTPRSGWLSSIQRTWLPGDVLRINFEMPIRWLHADPKVRGHSGKAALTRGPLVYCLEDCDNHGVDIFKTVVETASAHAIFDETMLGGIMKIMARSRDGHNLTFIPYHLWGNRGPSQMTVWVNT